MTCFFLASNYIINTGVGYEAAKACAVIEDSRPSENKLENTDKVVAKKPGNNFLSGHTLCCVAVVWHNGYRVGSNSFYSEKAECGKYGQMQQQNIKPEGCKMS